jgi:rhomboid protease GluP
LISAKAQKCIHCGLAKPGWYASFPLLNSLLRGKISFHGGLILACFLLYVLALGLDLPGIVFLGNGMASLSPSNLALEKLGMGGRIPLLEGRWWTLLTATYLHGGILHILFNMLWLRQIGPLVEELFGASRFIVLYTAAGVIGALLSTAAGTPLFVGASGSIFGLFGALIFYGWRRGGTFGSMIFRRMLYWAAFGLVFGLLNSGVDNWGHVGGFIGGFAIASLMSYQERKRQGLSDHLIALGTLVFIAVCFLLMLITFLRA